MELAALVAFGATLSSLGLASAKLSEILRSPGYDVFE